MHELSVAQSIVDIVRESVGAEDRPAVRTIAVRVGEMSGVVADSLEFCFSAVTRETPLEGATLMIERVPYVVSCSACGKESSPDWGMVLCPHCGSPETRVLSGMELQVVEVELVDPLPPVGMPERSDPHHPQQ